MRKLALLLIGLTLGLQLKAQIRGKAPAYAGQLITLYEIDDLFSNRLIKRDQTQIREDGKFTLKYQLDTTKLCILRVNYVNAKLFVAPRSTYNVHFPKLPADQPKSINNTNRVELTYEDLDPYDLNALIPDFNYHWEAFLAENLPLLIEHHRPNHQQTEEDSILPASKSGPLKKLRLAKDTFSLKINRYYNDIASPFLKNYIQYTIASFEAKLGYTKKYLFEKHLTSGAFYIHNPAYVQFVTEFYNSYLESTALRGQKEKIAEIINQRKQAHELVGLLGENDFLKTPQMTELIAIQLLYQNFGKKGFSALAVQKMLKQLSEEGVFQANQAIAKNCLFQITKAYPGFPATPFDLEGYHGERIVLEDYTGRFVLLYFWASWCTPCLAEMEVMRDLHAKYKKYVQFIGISIDEKKAEMDHFLKADPYPWKMAHFADNRDIKEAYDVQSVPSFFLIDNNGLFYKSPAKLPSEGLENDLYQLKIKSEKEEKIKIWDD